MALNNKETLLMSIHNFLLNILWVFTGVAVAKWTNRKRVIPCMSLLITCPYFHRFGLHCLSKCVHLYGNQKEPRDLQQADFTCPEWGQHPDWWARSRLLRHDGPAVLLLLIWEKGWTAKADVKSLLDNEWSWKFSVCVDKYAQLCFHFGIQFSLRLWSVRWNRY